MASIENENLKQDKGWLIKFLSLACTIGLMISSYFLTATVNKLDALEKRIHTIELSDATSTAVNFKNSDWYIAKSLIEADKLAAEKRLTNLENSIPVIKETLIRIESLVEKQNSK